MARMAVKKQANKTLPGIPTAKAQLGGKMRRREDSIDMDLKEMRYEVMTCRYLM